MKFLDFIKCLNSVYHLHQEKPVIVCTTSSYQSFFWQLIKRHFIEQQQLFETLNTMYFSKTEVLATITASFLGMSHTILVISSSEGKIRELDHDLIALLNRYQGPHRLIVLIPPSQRREWEEDEVIEIPEKIDQTLCGYIVSFVTGDERGKFVARACETLDQACMFGIGLHLVGKQSEQWLFENIIPEHQGSLFVLAQHLLGREKNQFYQHWSLWRNRYPDEFWISFWSDRFWHAYLWIASQKHSALSDIGSAIKGLPFRFMKRDWTALNQRHCIKALEYLYAFDYQLKNGGSTTPFELVFQLFFV